MAKSKLTRALDRIKDAREKSAQTIKTGVAALETTGAASLMAYLRGRYPTADENGNIKDEFEIGGVPVNLATGVALHLTGFLGIAPKNYQDDAHNLANGCLAEYAVMQMHRVGRTGLNEARAKDNLPAAPTGSSPAMQGYGPGDRVMGPHYFNGGAGPAYGRMYNSRPPFAHQNQAFQGL